MKYAETLAEIQQEKEQLELELMKVTSKVLTEWQKELDEGDPYYNRNFPMTTEAYVLASE